MPQELEHWKIVLNIHNVYEVGSLCEWRDHNSWCQGKQQYSV